MSRGSSDQLQQTHQAEQGPPIPPKISNRNRSPYSTAAINATASSPTDNGTYEPFPVSPDDPRSSIVEHNFRYPTRTSQAPPQRTGAADSTQPLWYSGNGFTPQHGGGESYVAYQPRVSERYQNGNLRADTAGGGRTTVPDHQNYGDVNRLSDSQAPSQRPSTYQNLKTAAAGLHVRLPSSS